MKKIIIILTFALFSCNDNTNHVKKTTMYLYNGSGWNKSVVPFECDSVKMLSKSEAIYWVNGFESKAYAELITISR